MVVSLVMARETEILKTSTKRIYKNGDIIIGGMFPFHSELHRDDESVESGPIVHVCSSLFPEGYRLAEAMIFALEEINNNPDFVPGIKLGYDIRDTCSSVAPSAETAIDFIKSAILGSQLVKAVVGASLSSVSMAVNPIFGTYNIPFVSYGSTSTLLQDRLRYKTFMRTIPSDLSQSLAMIELIRRFGWEWIATIATDDDYGRQGIQMVIEEMEDLGACVAFSRLLQTNATQRIVEEIVTLLTKDPSIKVIATFIHPSEMRVILKEATRQNITDRIWLACEAWSDNPDVAHDMYHQVDGTLGIVLSQGHIPGFAEYLRSVSPFTTEHQNPFLTEMWEKEFECKMPLIHNNGKTPVSPILNPRKVKEEDANNLTPPAIGQQCPFSNGTVTGRIEKINLTCSDDHTENLENLVDDGGGTNSTGPEILSTQYTPPICSDSHTFDQTKSYKGSNYRITYNVYLAVYAIGQALDSIVKCKEPYGRLENGSCPNVTSLQPWQLLKYLRNITFLHGTEGIRYNMEDNEESKGRYEINNWQKARTDGINLVPVGFFDGGAETNKLVLRDYAIRWNDGSTKIPISVCTTPCPLGTRRAILDGRPPCCFECVPCAEGEIANITGAVFCTTCPDGYWSNSDKSNCIEKTLDYIEWTSPSGITLEVLVAIGVTLTLLCSGAFIYHRHTPIIKACNRELSYLMLFYLLCCYVGCLAYLGLPSGILCTIRIANGIAYTGCVAILFVKTQRLVSIFNARLGSSRIRKKLAGLMYQFLTVFTFVFVHVTLVVITHIVAPPIVERNTKISTTKTYVQCTPTSQGLALSRSIYTWILAGVCLFFAFRARKLPNNFNEAKFITFAMFMYFSVWSIYYPVSLWTYGKLKALSQAIVIFVSSTFILVCIFLPKLYIVLLKPEFNTKEVLRQQIRKHSERQSSKADMVAQTDTCVSNAGNDKRNNIVMADKSVELLGGIIAPHAENNLNSEQTVPTKSIALDKYNSDNHSSIVGSPV
ncbi:extracellular calcium-sensing receptor-like [Ptychodera flava]|uniref:extracellular calcium-sensing receptor-like n=1 Tax=Ptychodera flava TaxID=63121 RepID=UPI003969EDFD